MKLEDQVSSLELSKKLKSLGVKQESLFYWDEDGHYVWRDEELQDATGKFHVENCWSAFTVAELGEMLPKSISRNDRTLFFRQCFNGKGEHLATYHRAEDEEWYAETIGFEDKNEADARAKMLCYLIEKGIVDAKSL